MDVIQKIETEILTKSDAVENFSVGDTISVHYRIVEGTKERVQVFQGFVLQIKGKGINKTFTVRKISSQIGVERIFSLCSPFVKEIKVIKKGKVRQSRIFYLRELKGKNLKIKEYRKGKKAEK